MESPPQVPAGDLTDVRDRQKAGAANADAAQEHEVTALREILNQTQRQLSEEQATVVTLRGALEASNAELRGVHASLSWRLTRPLRLTRDLLGSVAPFIHEMRGFSTRARYTIATRGTRALWDDVAKELGTRLRRGSLAMPPAAQPEAHAAALVPFAARGDRLEWRPLHFVLPAVPHVTIVIPVFNQFARTYACLASILERTGDISYEVVVSDDASTDETKDLDRMTTGVRIVRAEENRGFIETCNRGAEAARGEFVVFLNNDTFVSHGWLGALLSVFENGHADTIEVGLAGAKLVYPDGRLQEAGGILFSDGSAWNYGRGDDPANPKYEFQCDAHYCSGCGIIVRRDLFHSLGGFDRHFAPMYYEDVDLALAVRAAGFRVVYQPQSLIVHFEGGTAGTDTSSGSKRFQPINQRKLVEKWGATLSRLPAPGTAPDIARHEPCGPRVLIIDSYTPRPDHDAGSVRMFQICRILRELGCRVTFIPENRAFDGRYTRALQAEGVEALYHPYLPSLEAHLKKAGDRYHAVILSRVDTARAFIELVQRECPHARLLFDTVDLHFLREGRRAALGRGGASRHERLKTEELEIARACDTTFVVSRVEADLLAREAPDLSVELLSLIVTPEPTTTPFAERRGIVFIANFQHPPNCDALEDYLQNVHPLVRQRLPDVLLTVIGPHVPPHLQRLGEGSVEFTGSVPDIRPRFASARLSVAPLRYGAGIKGKVCTSLAFGVPAVTTTIGAEGMDLTNGNDILIADDPQAFADGVVALHSDERLWSRLAQAGPASIGAQFSPDHARRTLARVLGVPVPDAPRNAGAIQPE